MKNTASRVYPAFKTKESEASKLRTPASAMTEALKKVYKKLAIGYRSEIACCNGIKTDSTK